MVTPAYTQAAQPERKWLQSQWGRGVQGIPGFENGMLRGAKAGFAGRKTAYCASKNGIFIFITTTNLTKKNE